MIVSIPDLFTLSYFVIASYFPSVVDCSQSFYYESVCILGKAINPHILRMRG